MKVYILKLIKFNKNMGKPEYLYNIIIQYEFAIPICL